MRWLPLIALVLSSACTKAKTERCTASWRPIMADLDRTVLAVGGSAEDDVYIVGGGLGTPGRGALIAHWDGFFWRELATQRPETIWWVHTIAKNDVWMVGDDGLVMHWNGKRFLVVPTQTSATLFGAWGTKSDDVWFVGGKPGRGENDDNEMLLHWDGRKMTRERSSPRRGVSFFKVCDGQGELWITGESGTLFQRAGGEWRDRSSEVRILSSPFSLGGCSKDELYAVGGKSVFSYDGDRWTQEEVDVPTLAVGVACGPSSVLVVGIGGTKLRYDKDREEWFDEQLEEPYEFDLHGAWVAPDGSEWVGGGNFLVPASPERVGVLGYRGCEEISSAITIVDRVPMMTEEVFGEADAGEPEPDAAVPDAEEADAGTPDAEEPDAAAPDATEMSPDAGCSGAPRAPNAGDLILNEILVDPAAGLEEGDANADGERSATEDEFIEIANVSGSPIALDGIVLSDTVEVRHIFASRTLGCGEAIAVFGGGDPFHPAWRPNWVLASEGALGFNNDGDVVSLGIYTFELLNYAFGAEAEIDQSLVRSQDLDPNAPLVPHTSTPGGGRFSPGTRSDGAPF